MKRVNSLLHDRWCRLWTGCLAAAVLLAPSPASGWKEISCDEPMGSSSFNVPKSCADVCASDFLERMVKAYTPSQKKFYIEQFEKAQAGQPFYHQVMDLCRINEWACANGFTLSAGCGSRGGIEWKMEKSLGKTGSRILISPVSYQSIEVKDPASGEYRSLSVPTFYGLIVAAYPLQEPFPEPLSKRNDRGRGGYDETARRHIQEGDIKGILETQVIYDVNPGPNDTLIPSGRQSAIGVLYAPGLGVVMDYNEYYPYTSDMQTAELLLKSFIAAHRSDNLRFLELMAGQGLGSPLAQTGQGVEFLIRYSAPGFESQEFKKAVPDFTPSSITVRGTVKDEAGLLIPEAEIALPDLNKTMTSPDGAYSFTAETKGDQPFTLQMDVILKQKTSGAQILFTVEGLSDTGFIPIPSGPATMNVKVMASDDHGAPLRDRTVRLALAQADRLPFLTLEGSARRLDERGTAVFACGWRKPAEEEARSIKDIPLEATFSVTVEDPGAGAVLARRDFTYPLGLVLLHGTTVGPDMKPRAEAAPPRLMTDSAGPLSHILSALDPSHEGEFYVLVRPLAAIGATSALLWPPSCRLPLNVPLRLLLDRAGARDKDALKAGERVELGTADVLTPAEHERRIKDFVREIITRMVLSPEEQAALLRDLEAVTFRGGSSGAVPDYTQWDISPPGRVSIPGELEKYWGSQPYEVLNSQANPDPSMREDPAYPILMHELGHFIHARLVETARLKAFYNLLKGAGSSHTTWRPPDTSVEWSRTLVSFNEATAEFFAYAAFRFLENVHPEFKASVYFERGYLSEFDTDAKARGAASLGGCRVEGVQTVFLRTLYDGSMTSEAPRAYGDYLRTMLSQKEDAWFLKWIPARTMAEWIPLKIMHGGLAAGDAARLGKSFNILPCAELEILLTPLPPQWPLLTLGGRLLTEDRKQVLIPVLIGEEIAVQKGRAALILLDRERTDYARLTLAEGCALVVESSRQVRLLRGRAAMSGPVTVVTSDGSFIPEGTLWTVEVSPSGAATIKVFEGRVRARTSAGEEILTAGQAASILSGGIMRKAFDARDPGALAPFRGSETTDPYRGEQEIPSTSPVPPPAAPLPQTGRTPSFWAVRRGTECLVVVGEEGLTAGDTVLGSFPSFEPAQATLEKQCETALPPSVFPEDKPVGKGILLSCKKGDHSEKECCCYKSAHTYVFPAQRAEKVRATFNTGKGSGCKSTVEIEADRGKGWEVLRRVEADSTTPVEMDVPIGGEIRGFRLRDGCVCCLDHSEIVLTPSVAAPLQAEPLASEVPLTAPDNALISPILALPKYDSDDSTEGIFFVHLDTGNAFFIDKIKSSPRDIRSRNLNQNVFSALGRTPGKPALPGQVLIGEVRLAGGDVHALLLADTSSGAMTFIVDLQTHSYQGRIKSVRGRPLGALAVQDGRFALLMIQGDSAETIAALVYHAPTGRGILIEGLRDLNQEPSVVPLPSLPVLAGAVTLLPLQTGNQSTPQALLIGQSTGDLYRFSGLLKGARKVTWARERLRLMDVFPPQGEVPVTARFLPIPIFSGSDTTKSVLVVDGATGRLSQLREVRDAKEMTLRGLSGNVYDLLPKDVGRPRTFAAVPKVNDSGATEGAWIFDSATGQVLYIGGLEDPEGLTLLPVLQKTR